MNIKERVFLITGSDFFARKQAIESTKRRFLRNRINSFNITTFFCNDIEIRKFQEKLLTRSLKDVQLFIFKNFLKLPVPARNFIFEQLKKILADSFLIFESEKDYYLIAKELNKAKDGLFSKLLKGLVPIRAGFTKKELSIYDFIKSLDRKDLGNCLYTLESLFRQGAKQNILGPQIIGILVNKISKLVKSRQKDIYLSYVWDADRAIKEGGKDSRLILEALLVSLLKPSSQDSKGQFAAR